MAQNYWMDDGQQNNWYGQNGGNNAGQDWGQFDYSQNKAPAPGGNIYSFNYFSGLAATTHQGNNYYDQQQQNYSQNNYYGGQMFVPNQSSKSKC